MNRTRWIAAVLGSGIALALTGWGAGQALEGWRYRSALREADQHLLRGRYGQAREVLAVLAARWPDVGEVQVRLGRCERALGRIDAALAAWSRVAPGTTAAGRVALDCARLALEHGRFTIAEEALRRALDVADGPHDEASWELARLLRFEGRLDEVRAVLLDRLEAGIDPVGTLRDLWELDARPIPIDGVRSVLEEAARKAPTEDRVWLGLANLAIHTGDLAEAARLLDRCAARRPDDPAVTQARLHLALRAGDEHAVRTARDRLPAGLDSPAGCAALAVWLAARRGESLQERDALRQLAAACPHNPAVLERLIVLSSSDPETTAQLREQKSALDQAQGRYDALMDADAGSPLPHAAELARLAHALGRHAEALAWVRLRLAQAPRDAEARRLRDRLIADGPGRCTHSTLMTTAISTHPTRGVSASAELVGTTPHFTDDAEAVGLHFTFDNGRSTLRQLPETMSGGLAILDYDGDGWLDIYCVQGGRFPPPPGAPNADRLFRNRGDGTFEDATETAGIAAMAGGYGHGVLAGDYDSDGHTDLFITRWRAYQLLRSRGDGTFEDVTESAGLGGDRDWPTSAAFADLDGDGDLDLYICHYLEWDTAHPRLCRHNATGPYQYCSPRHFPALPDHLFRNDNGRFIDVTAEAGIDDPDGRGLGVLTADLDGDGLVDLYVANDMTANTLYRNLGGFRFEEVGHPAGVAGNAAGGYQAGMGIARGDLDGDGWLDLAVTNFYGEGTTYYRALEPGLFYDDSQAHGLFLPTRDQLGFGVVMLDVDADGRLDLVQANGHVTDTEPIIPYAMPAQLLLGTDDGPLRDVSRLAGPPWQPRRLGRGLAAGDLDNDGRVDLLLIGQNEPLAYFHNRTDGGHWVSFELEGTISNRDAIGAVVTLTARERVFVVERFGGGSYQSTSSPRLHIGLGDVRRIDLVEVRWPSGHVDRHRNLLADVSYRLREGDTATIPLPAPQSGVDRDVAVEPGE